MRMIRVRKQVATAVAAVFAGLAAAAGPPALAAPLTLTLMHVNDWTLMAGVGGAGGAARIAAVVAEERARAEAAGGRALATFGGDMLSPSVLSGIDQGAHMIDLANAVGFDFAVTGNHEFDFGPTVLAERLAESEAVWLAGNVTLAGGRFPGTRATAVVAAGDFRIGFLGLVTPETAMISSPGPEAAFAPVAEAGAGLAELLRAEGADIVIALTHQGLDADLELLGRVPSIDIVLGGHDHLLVARHDGRQAVLQAGAQGRHVGVLTLAIDRVHGEGGPRVVSTPEFRLRSTAGSAGDARVAARVRDYQTRLDARLDGVIGETAVELRTRGYWRGSVETAFGNLLADAMRLATGADIALTNSGGIRGDTVYPAGTRLTRKMVLSELPFGDRTVVLRLTGAEIREALENGVSRIGHPSGRFPQVSGLAFSFAPRRPPGERVTRVMVGDAPLAASRVYTLATNDFLAGGGDGYGVFAAGEVVVDAVSGGLTTGQLIDHIIAAGTVAPAIEGRITREE